MEYYEGRGMNRAALVDFMEDVLRIQRWYLDPKNHEEVKKIAAGERSAEVLAFVRSLAEGAHSARG